VLPIRIIFTSNIVNFFPFSDVTSSSCFSRSSVTLILTGCSSFPMEPKFVANVMFSTFCWPSSFNPRFLGNFHGSVTWKRLKNTDLDTVLDLKVYTAGVAKVRPAGHIRPPNLFLRPLDLFVIWKKHCKNQTNSKNFQKCLILISISIKNNHRWEKMTSKFFCYAEFPITRPSPIRESSNLALENKSLVTPGL